MHDLPSAVPPAPPPLPVAFDNPLGGRETTLLSLLANL